MGKPREEEYGNILWQDNLARVNSRVQVIIQCGQKQERKKNGKTEYKFHNGNFP